MYTIHVNVKSQEGCRLHCVVNDANEVVLRTPSAEKALNWCKDQGSTNVLLQFESGTWGCVFRDK